MESNTLNCRGRLLDLTQPHVMGILNLTPDSFSDGGKFTDLDAALKQTERMLTAGASIIDVGGYSSRPGADEVSPGEELRRVSAVLPSLIEHFPDALFSLDTFRADVAEPMVEAGIQIINDITAGRADDALMKLAAKHRMPYIAMHMQGTPQTMQKAPTYRDPVNEISNFLVDRMNTLRATGIHDIILDPGFGFGKSADHNYALFAGLADICALGAPVLIGISRKKMVSAHLGIERNASLPATTALHLQAIRNGVRILRVHDVEPAMQALKAVEKLTAAQQPD